MLSQIRIIFQKELTEVLRDKRTLLTMILIPLALYPLLLGVIGKVSENQISKAMEKEHTIWVYGAEQDQVGLMQALRQVPATRFVEKGSAIDFSALDSQQIRRWIQTDSIHMLLHIQEGFGKAVADSGVGNLGVYYITDEDVNIGKSKVVKGIEAIKAQIIEQRFAQKRVSADYREAIRIAEHDMASEREQQGNTIGGLLPYMFMIFAMMGAMYPAIDLGAGEKERGTVDTLLILPIHPYAALIGKLGVISCSGLASALFSLVGVWLSTQVASSEMMPLDLEGMIQSVLQLEVILGMIVLLLPCTILFASALLTLSFFAKSYKEAQSTVTPLMIVVILPSVIGMLPGMELDMSTVWAPILNVSLAMKQLIAGTLSAGWLVFTAAVMLVYAGVLVYICSRIFRKESVMVG